MAWTGPGQGWVVLPRRPSWVRRTLTCHSADAWPRFEAQLPTLATPTPRTGPAQPAHLGGPPAQGPPGGSFNCLWRLHPLGPQAGAPGLTGSPQSQPRCRAGTTQGWEPAEAPQKAKNRLGVAASASGPGPRATAVGSGLVWEETADQATRTSIRFNPVQQGLGGFRTDPRPDSPAAIAGGGAGGGGAWTQPRANL